jgi:outer membrane protein OmpA-like peptidoglycan-associated protein
MKKLLLTYVFLFVGLQFLVSQEKAMQSADSYFENRDYVNAIKQYKKALRKSDNFRLQKNIAYHIALSYYNMNDYNGALEWFEEASGDASKEDLYIKYSEALSIEGKYEEAISILQQINNSSADKAFIDQKIAGIRLISKQIINDTLGLVFSEDDLNTEYSDYGISPWENKFVISSARKEGSRIDGRTGQGFSNLFSSQMDENGNSWSPPRKISGKFNTNENEGSFSYDEINQTAYWTRCTEKSDLCLIYLSHFNPFKNSWTKPEKAKFQISGFNYGHPFISNDGRTLVFSSNLPDGFGEKDIWKIGRKQDGSWGIAVNLGPQVNTEGNEAFPSLYGDSLLFFTSDRHKNLGRYDIFFSLKEGLQFSKVANLGYPINSAADDYGIVLDDSGKNGWFCSDRNLETSDDIYGFNGFPIKISVIGKVLHKTDNQPIANAKIVYTSEDDVSDSLTSNENGEFILYLNAFDEYRISAIKDNYYTEHKTVNTSKKEILFAPPPQKEVNFQLSKTQYNCAIRGLISNRETQKPMADVKVEIYNEDGFSTYSKSNSQGIYQFEGLKPRTIYTVRTSKEGYFSESRVCNLPLVDATSVFWKGNGYDMDFELMKIEVKSEITLNNIYYDFNKSSLRESSIIELNKLASMLFETPNVVVQISSHTDAIGTPDYNMKLSADRAQSVVDYLIMYGIDRSRLIAKGYGESKLLIKYAKTDAEHQANRRTTFKVVEILGGKRKNIAESESVYDDFNQTNNLVYRIQIATTSKPKNMASAFSDIKNKFDGIIINENIIGGIYKYEVGEFNNFKDVKELQKALKKLGYKDCFIISYFKEQKIAVSKAIKMEKY